MSIIVGDKRLKNRRIVMTCETTVIVELPEGDDINIDLDEIKAIAASACKDRWERDVGPVGHIVWAQCYSEATTDDVEIIEDVPIDPPKR